MSLQKSVLTPGSRPSIHCSLTGNTINLAVPAEFNKGILESRYQTLIKNAIKQVTFKEYEIAFIVPSQENLNKLTKQTESAGNEDSPLSVLNPKYTFDTFVIGNSNRFAHAAALAVAEAPGKAYNPCSYMAEWDLEDSSYACHRALHSGTEFFQKVLYVSSEKFTNELINAIKDNRNEEFRSKYRNIDVLLIDDIQFIAGRKERRRSSSIPSMLFTKQTNR